MAGNGTVHLEFVNSPSILKYICTKHLPFVIVHVLCSLRIYTFLKKQLAIMLINHVTMFRHH